jgi:hypothetical protein
MTSLLDLIRARRAELEAAAVYTDDQRRRALQAFIRDAHRDSHGVHAKLLADIRQRYEPFCRLHRRAPRRAGSARQMSRDFKRHLGHTRVRSPSSA